MYVLKIAAGLAMVTSLAACELDGLSQVGADKSRDRGFRSHHLSTMTAGIWVDPNGCDHWIIDDGVEGYLSQRLDKYGKPVCSQAAPPNTVVGPFKDGQTISDPL